MSEYLFYTVLEFTLNNVLYLYINEITKTYKYCNSGLHPKTTSLSHGTANPVHATKTSLEVCGLPTFKFVNMITDWLSGFLCFNYIIIDLLISIS